jgi:hypothetical protein
MSHVMCHSSTQTQTAKTSRQVPFFQKRWLKMNGMLHGPWNHEAAMMYTYHGPLPFNYCMQFSTPGQPPPKFLVMLRDPIERFFSYIQFFWTIAGHKKGKYMQSAIKWMSPRQYRSNSTNNNGSVSSGEGNIDQIVAKEDGGRDTIPDDDLIHAPTEEIIEWFENWPGLDAAPLFEYESVFGGERLEFIPDILQIRPKQKFNRMDDETRRQVIQRAKDRIDTEVIVGVMEHMEDSLVLFMLALQLPMPSSLCSPLGNGLRVRVDVVPNNSSNETSTTDRISKVDEINSRKTFQSRCDPRFLNDLKTYGLASEIAIYDHAYRVHKDQVESMN